jgi:hypothetical protein
MEPIGVTIQQLYPELNDQQLKEADENIAAYLQLVIRIYQRHLAEKQEGNSPGNDSGRLPVELPAFVAKKS